MRYFKVQYSYTIKYTYKSRKSFLVVYFTVSYSDILKYSYVRIKCCYDTQKYRLALLIVSQFATNSIAIRY